MPASTILDPSGRPYTLPRPRAQAYHAASYGARFQSLRGSSISATAAVISNASTLRNRAHELVNNNPWAWRGIASFVANLIGTGIIPDTQMPNLAEAELTEQLWEDSLNEMDASGVTTGYGLQTQAANAMVEGGEAFIRVRQRRLTDGLAVPVQFQVLEADHVPLDMNHKAPNGNQIKGGIEFNGFGQREAYWMYPTHPGDQLFQSGVNDTRRIPASDVFHLFAPRRPGQIRDVSWLSRILLRLHDADETTDAQIMLEKVQSMFVGFMTTPDNGQPFDPLSGEEATQRSQDFTADVVPGTFQSLPPGYDITFGSPNGSSPNFEASMKHQLRSVASGLPITYEQLTGDLRDVNFSSIRAGLIEMRRIVSSYIWNWVVFQLCEQMWRRWLREAVLSGALPFLAAYAANPRVYNRVRWVPPKWDFVNPLQENQAELMEFRMGVKSRSEGVAMRGRKRRDLDEEIKQDNASNDQLGFRFTSDPRNGIAK